MSNVNERNVNAEPKPSYCELNEEALDIVAGGWLPYTTLFRPDDRSILLMNIGGSQPNS
jgi:hypothetical protein